MRARVGDLFPARSTSEAETRALGRELAARLESGDVVALYGDLGAGKTVFTRGLCEGLKARADDVQSPTFTILHEYTSGTVPVYHFDAYRIERLEEFYDLGYEEYFFGDGICVIEWADKVEPLLPETAVRVRLVHEAGSIRCIGLAQ